MLISAHRSIDESDDLRALLDRFSPRIEALLVHYGIAAVDAEDLIAQVLLEFLYKHDRIQDPERWMLGRFKSLCLESLRARRRPSNPGVPAES